VVEPGEDVDQGGVELPTALAEDLVDGLSTGHASF
jgi:hypothetical protein